MESFVAAAITGTERVANKQTDILLCIYRLHWFNETLYQ